MSAKVGSPDVLYFVKESEENEELKYSLRSLKNLNHGKVFIAGYKPSWVGDSVIHIATDQSSGKYENVRGNLLAALNDSRLGEDFILMNDDFFVMHPTLEIPTLRRMKNIEHYIKIYSKLDPKSRYVTSMQRTKETLESWGITDISSYELHVPMLLNKKKVVELLKKAPKEIHLRTLYGNYYDLGGERIRDVKIIKEDQTIPFDQQFLSTIDASFKNGSIGKYLRNKLAKVLIFSNANDPNGLLSVILAKLAFAEVDYLLTNDPQTDIIRYLHDHNGELKDYDYTIISDVYPEKSAISKLPNLYLFGSKKDKKGEFENMRTKLTNSVVKVEIDGRPTTGSELLYRWLKELEVISDEPAGFVEFIRQIVTWDFK